MSYYIWNNVLNLFSYPINFNQSYSNMVIEISKDQSR